MKKYIKQISILKYLIIIIRTLNIKPSFYKRITNLGSYFNDLRNFRRSESNNNFIIETGDLYPRIFDKTNETKLDPIYYIQGCWCAKKIFDNKPAHHYDIGSQVQMVGIISQFVPTTMIDIRPLSVDLESLSFIKGDITNLPFKNNSIKSLSSICVIEHIGLGRYGDRLDQFGTEKSAKELSRVLEKNGNLYISAPVDSENRIYFNAHRAMTRHYILELFKELNLVEEKYIYGNKIYHKYEIDKGFGTGLFHFRK